MSPTSTCECCGGTLRWRWEEAFEKFGFGDGDGQVMTETVADVLRAAGYVVSAFTWGMHNTIISSVKRDCVELIPDSADVGYDNPRKYLPKKIIQILDDKLSPNAEVVS